MNSSEHPPHVSAAAIAPVLIAGLAWLAALAGCSAGSEAGPGSGAVPTGSSEAAALTDGETVAVDFALTPEEGAAAGEDRPRPDLDKAEGPDAGTGRWRRAQARAPRAVATDDEAEAARLERLHALGYVSGSAPARAEMGVTVHDAERAWPGVNLYSSGHGPEALLIDMEGNLLHRWRKAYEEIWPGQPADEPAQNPEFWRKLHLAPNGDLTVIFEGIGLIRVDRDSNLLWERRNRAHHDLEVMPDGRILVLTRKHHVLPRLHPDEIIREDFVSELDAEGNLIREVSVVEAFENSRYREAFENRPIRTGDILHTNTLTVIDGTRPVDAGWYREGRVIVSARRLDAVAVIDLDEKAVVAAWKGPWRGQHDSKILDNGHMLLFDNFGVADHSRIMEIDVTTGRLEWHYRGTKEDPFYSRSCGTAERLPNGNTLITESDNGRAIEVTPAGDLVWEFHNPMRAGEDEEFVATLFEMVRFDPSVLAFLDPR